MFSIDTLSTFQRYEAVRGRLKISVLSNEKKSFVLITK